MAANEYFKLTPPRLKSAFAVVTASRSNLWLGKDHLLCVETEGYTEKYKRFYFRDIQAITLQRTHRALVLGVVTGAMTALFTSLMIWVDAVEGKTVLGILTGICAIPFILNLIHGPTCKCQLRTAVQTDYQPSMGRVRRARKVLNRIRPLIAEAQGLLTPEEIEARFREMVAPPDSEPPIMQPTEPASAQVTDHPEAMPPP
jgi:hypothetical protein